MSTIITRLAEQAPFTTLIRALTAAGMIDTLSGSGPFTLFAPTDAAFARLPTDRMAGLFTRDAREALTRLLTFHAVADKLMPNELSDGQLIPTINGQRLRIARNAGELHVNGINITARPLQASNGAIYVIDGVLFPATAG